jgi:hypothetical protein
MHPLPAAVCGMHSWALSQTQARTFCSFLFTTVLLCVLAPWKELDQFFSIESEPGLIESATSGQERHSPGTVGSDLT